MNMPSKILIADDEAFIRLLIEQTLEDIADQDNVVIYIAQNGIEASQLIHQHKPDLVFLDIMMPGMNGYEVCAKAREEFKDEITIILLTAKGQQVDRRLGEQAGANRYITKPFDPDQLVEIAKTILHL
jgi:two-component system, OmpR family, alkaline phosphatase synthesis response regulator PhoP